MRAEESEEVEKKEEKKKKKKETEVSIARNVLRPHQTTQSLSLSAHDITVIRSQLLQSRLVGCSLWALRLLCTLRRVHPVLLIVLLVAC